MNDRHLVTQTMKATDVRLRFASVINRVARKEARIVVEKSGIPVAGIVTADDLRRLDHLDQLDQAREADFAIVDELRAAFRDVSDGEIERETDRVLGTVGADEDASVR
ncbi:MAG: type II toxin-antitoxin system Phd/YefM family antitoxin [Chloroflexota bacterium]|nr:type II toxin-antitoxin system Phd/YefM family antitoxin [Chloroflexota bacterium]